MGVYIIKKKKHSQEPEFLKINVFKNQNRYVS